MSDVPLAMARRKAREEAEKRAGGLTLGMPVGSRWSAIGGSAQQVRFDGARLACPGAEEPSVVRELCRKVIRHLELHVFPWIGSLAMEAIKPTELVRCLHRIRDRGILETAQRAREAVQHVFQYAVDLGKA